MGDFFGYIKGIGLLVMVVFLWVWLKVKKDKFLTMDKAESILMKKIKGR